MQIITGVGRVVGKNDSSPFFYADVQVVLDSPVFINTIIACIVLAGILVGVQTYPSMESNPVLDAFNAFVQVAFSVECILKIWREGPRPLRYW